MPGYIEHIRDMHGTPSKPLVIDLEGVTIDGEWNAVPLYIHDCSDVILRNVNLCRSRAAVFWGANCTRCRFERICAWDADPDENYNPVHLNGCTRCQVVDFAGWGSGRKIFSGSQGGDDTTYYRAFARWERSTCPGWKLSFALAYNHRRNWFSHCIGQCLHLPAVPREFRGIFADDRIDSGARADTFVHKCLAISDHDVMGFQDSLTRGIAFDRCVEATARRAGNSQDMLDIMDHWARSPMLERIRDLAGCDVMTLLRSAALSVDDEPAPLSQ